MEHQNKQRIIIILDCPSYACVVALTLYHVFRSMGGRCEQIHLTYCKHSLRRLTPADIRFIYRIFFAILDGLYIGLIYYPTIDEKHVRPLQERFTLHPYKGIGIEHFRIIVRTSGSKRHRGFRENVCASVERARTKIRTYGNTFHSSLLTLVFRYVCTPLNLHLTGEAIRSLATSWGYW